MKCRKCKAPAIIDLPSHNTAFCEKCFLEFFTKQIEKGIESQKLFNKDDKILVALSGGKDSLTLMLQLVQLGYNVTGLHIDLAIPNSSDVTRGVVERFCTKHNLPLIVKDMAQEGLAIPLVKERLNRPICSVCGKIKRHYFNRIAIEGGYNVLATGHNLDDEVARLFSNTLRWDSAYLSDQGPCLESEKGFAKKVKPLWRLTEFETAHYAYLMGIEYHYAPCPYSPGASFTFHKGLWLDLEEKMPGRKIDFYQGFLTRGRAAFTHLEKDSPELTPCSICHCPSSQHTCGVCKIKAMLKEEAKE